MARFDEKLATLLSKRRVITDSQRDEALVACEKSNSSFTEMVISKKYCDEEALITAVADEMNYYPIDLSRIEVSPDALQVLTKEQANSYHALPIAKMGEMLTLAISNPFDVLLLDDVKIMTRLEVMPVLATEMSVRRSIDRAFKKANDVAPDHRGENQIYPKFEEKDRYNSYMRECLVKLGLVAGQVSEDVIAHTIVQQFSRPFISASQCRIASDVFSIFPRHTYYENRFIAIQRLGKVIVIIAAGLMRSDMHHELEKSSGCTVCPFVSTWSDIRATLNRNT